MDPHRSLQQENQALRQYIHSLEHYIQQLKIYEYHIELVNIEKVKGTLQFGQLLKNEIADENGVHRFHIGEIKITEIEGTGTVGIGITEIDKKPKKKPDKIPPEEASEDIKKIYEQIKKKLQLQQVPEFFQKLAVKKEVLKQTWEAVKSNSEDDFQHFFEALLQVLNNHLSLSIEGSAPSLQSDTCEKISDSIEEKGKTLFVVVFLLKLLLPGLLKEKLDKAKQEIDIITIQPLDDDKKEPSGDFLQSFKQSLELQQLPKPIKDLSDSPKKLEFVATEIFHPSIKSGSFTEALSEMKQLFVEVKTNDADAKEIRKPLKPEEEGFLYSHLIDALDEYPKQILLEYLFLPLCKNEVQEDASAT